MRFHSLIGATFLVMASAAGADPLPDMAGAWKGTGWARETRDGPQETVRCQLTNSFDSASLTLTLAGRCAVPGRKLTMSGKLQGAAQSERITGRWFNPDGIGSAPVVGVQRGGIVAFNFNATDPATGRKLAQNVEWRVAKGSLRLRSTDRDDPSIMMSDITFTK